MTNSGYCTYKYKIIVHPIQMGLIMVTNLSLKSVNPCIVFALGMKRSPIGSEGSPHKMDNLDIWPTER